MADDPLSELLGMGGLISPQPQAAPRDQPGGSWTSFLADPINRSALLSFSAQALTPGWGGLGANMGQALGAAGEGASNTAKAMQQQGNIDREFAAKEHEGEANRASHEKIAGITADSREAAATIRGMYSLDRARLSLQKAPANLSSKYLESARKEVDNTLGNLGLDDKTRTELIIQKAAQFYDADAARGLVPKAEGSASGVGAGAGTTPGSVGGTTPSGTAGASSGNILDKKLSDPTEGPALKEALMDPVRRRQLYNGVKDLEVKKALAERYPELLRGETINDRTSRQSRELDAALKKRAEDAAGAHKRLFGE